MTGEIPVRQPSVRLDEYAHLRDLPMIPGNVKVDILIGKDNPEALIPLEVRRGKEGDPFAVRTLFGWSVNGPVGDKANKQVTAHFITTASDTLYDIKKLWEIDNEDISGDDKGMSANERMVVELWDDKTVLKGGRYEIPIPWKKEAQFPNNLPVAVSRLHNLKKSLQKRQIFVRYDEEVKKLVSKGYAEPISEYERKGRTWYLPHQAVTTEKKPDKLRVVFDCAAKYNGESLNDKGLQGPDLNNKLVPVVIRFRQHEHAVVADIEAM